MDLINKTTMENKELKNNSDLIGELMIPEFVDVDWLQEQPQKVFRLDRSGHRYYYTLDKAGEPTFYTSVTTFIRQSLPTSPYLIEWMKTNGDNATKIADERAHYGTFLHMQCGDMMMEGKYDLDKLSEELGYYILNHRLDQSFAAYEHDLKKDVLAFAQFMIDHNVTPLAIEIILTHPEWRVAGAVDIVCEMDVEVKGYHGEVYKSGQNKGKPKLTKKTERVVAIVDIKSGRHGFYESHEIQLHAYKGMFERNFPNLKKIDMLFNWSPKDWRDVPSYNLKNQTNAKSAAKLPHLIEIARVEDKRINNTITVLGGEINLKDGVYKNIQTQELSEIVRGGQS